MEICKHNLFGQCFLISFFENLHNFPPRKEEDILGKIPYIIRCAMIRGRVKAQ